ncbi:hypothetical protein GCM10009801_75440 [Streptomyces albiaxialis]|uniref:Type IV secretion protein Rhs n=1 Tax=Streptomyces albiaxialis TaxID=329523 RepID=A0ABN2WZP4_9ACTN
MGWKDKLGDGLGKLGDGAKDLYNDTAPDWVKDPVEGAVEAGGEQLRKGTDAAAGQMDEWGWHKAADVTRGFGEGVNNRTGGDVPERELGESESAKDLIHGSPSKLRSTARYLKDFEKAFNAVGRGMRGLDSRHLRGEAANAFREKADVQPRRWFKAADACEKAGKALDDFAGTVEWAQRQAGDAIRAYRKGQSASAAHGRAAKFYADALAAYKELPKKDRKKGMLPDKPSAEDPGEAGMAEARETLAEARRQRDEAARVATAAVEAAREAAPPRPSYLARARSGVKGWALNAEHGMAGAVKAGSGMVNYGKQTSLVNPYNLTHPDEYATRLNGMASGMLASAQDPIGMAKGEWRSFIKDPQEYLGTFSVDALMGGAGKAGGTASKAARGAERAEGGAARRAGREAAEKEPHNGSRPEESKQVGEDPVDFATGRMLMPQTDLTLPGVLPLLVRRQFESSYRAGRWFGPTWSSTLDQRLEIDAEGVVLHGEANLLLAFPHPAPGVPVLARTGPCWELARTADGDYTVTEPDSGRVLHFTGPAGDPACDGVALLAEISDRNGNEITFEYDGDGAPRALVHSGGYHVKVATADGRITSLSLAGAAKDGSDQPVVHYGYDAAGNLAEITKSSGLPLRFGYDAQGRITSWTDTNNSHYRYAYDEHDRCVWQSGEEGHMQATFTYDQRDAATGHRVTTVTNSLGARTRYLVNDRNQIATVIDPTGAITRTEHDAHHRVLARTDALGHTTRVERDAEGRPTAKTAPDGTRTRVTYNALGLPMEVTGPDGAVWLHTYDERGNRTATTDPVGHTTRYAYTPEGHLTAVTDPLGHTTQVRCDAAGLPVEITDPLGGRTTYRRDAFGNPTAIVNPLGDTTRLTWTVEGKLARRVGPDGAEERWEYDGEGNCTRHIDPVGGATTYEYTHFDLLTARTGPDGVRYTFAHDSRLRLTQVRNPQGLTWSYSYDDADRLVGETDFDGRTRRYDLDPTGRLSATTTALGERITYERDAAGRLIRKDAAGAITTYAYDPAGRLTQATCPDTDLILQRDRMGRVKTELIDGRATTFVYDALGRARRRETPTGAQTTYAYDAAGNRTSLTTQGRTLTSVYDAAGRERDRRMEGSPLLSQRWDPTGRLTHQNVADIQQRTYSYGPDGNLLEVRDSLNGTRRYELDSAGRVTTVRARDWAERYAYDEAGNQTEAVWPSGLAPAQAAGARTHTGTRIQSAGRIHYEHDGAGRLVLRRKRRLSKKPETWRYEWDAEDRLRRVVTPGGTEWTYRYDPLGRRISKESGRERVDFTWHGATLIEQTTMGPNPNPVTLTWDHQGFTPVAQTERVTRDSSQSEIDSRFFAIVTDLIGTPTELISERGDLAWHARTTLWGTTTWNADATAYTPLRFPGQYADPETGLHYNCFRYYDPETARYASPDPLGLAPAPNSASYVHNPHTWADPLGLGPYRDFAHGTTLAHAESIVRDGLNTDAARAATNGGSLSRPGHFSVHEVAGPQSPGFQAAYEWGLRVDNHAPSSVVIARIPEEVYEKLVNEGKVATREVGEDVPTEIIFHPDSFEEINRVVKWIGPITP